MGGAHKADIGSLNDVFYNTTPPHAHIGYCKTNDQRADIFTKALQPQKWAHALDLLGIVHDYAESSVDDLSSIEIGEDTARVTLGRVSFLRRPPRNKGSKPLAVQSTTLFLN